MDSLKDTKRTYGFLWIKNKDIPPIDKWHFHVMQEVIDEPIVRGTIGIDVGSGRGYDTYCMAKNNPLVNIVSMDLSDGVHRVKRLTSELENVNIVKCSLANAPIKDDIFDFAYSFGVLHHIVDPNKGLLEIARLLKRNSPIFLYLYEDHSGSMIKKLAVKVVAKIRKVTVKMPPRVIYVLSCICSPAIFIIFSLPSIILKRFKSTQSFASKIPFNFGISFLSLRGDLYDRFSTPIEYRFSQSGVYDLLANCGFWKIKTTKLKDSAGWVVWGYKR